VGFNYLGRFAGAELDAWDDGPERRAIEDSESPVPLFHAIELNAVTYEVPEGPKLTANWRWAEQLFTQEEITELAESWFMVLLSIVRYAAQPGAGGRTPSDLPLVNLSQAEIEQIEAEQPPLADILPLSPLQQGLLFHALCNYDQQIQDVYTVQSVFELTGIVNTEAMRTAFSALLKRHPHLGAGFLHEGFEQPLQLIPRDSPLPWREIDLGGLDPAGQEGALRIRWGRFQLAAGRFLSGLSYVGAQPGPRRREGRLGKRAVGTGWTDEARSRRARHGERSRDADY
jgi:non-ribosomal peptide synthase protein (TIGR01720 family)